MRVTASNVTKGNPQRAKIAKRNNTIPTYALFAFFAVTQTPLLAEFEQQHFAFGRGAELDL
jgi:hypothetical protein